MEVLTVVVIVVVVVVIYHQQFRRKKINFPPGPYGLPLVGYLPFLERNTPRALTKLGEKYGKVMSVNMGGFKPVVVLNDWISVKEAFVKNGDKLSGRCPDLFTELAVQNSDIIFCDGPVWKEQKKLGHHILHELGVNRTSIESTIIEEVEKLSNYLSKQDGKPVKVYDIFFIPFINIIWGFAVGKTFKFSDKGIRHLKENIDYVITSTSMTVLNFLPFMSRIMPEKLGYNKLCKTAQAIYDYVDIEIDSHLKNFNKNSLTDGIDIYLAEIEKKKKEEGDKEMPPYDRKHLIWTVFDFVIAGHETLESTLSWALLYMIHFPEVQRRVQQELDKVVGKDSSLPLQSKSLIPYTEVTLLEIQRMGAVAPLAVPHRATEDMTLLGYDIPKDTKVMANVYAIHYDKEYWGDPEVFRPERFLDENGKITKYDKILPFSTGPRACLGERLARMEMHLFFTCLMRRFTFEMIPDEPKPSLEPQFSLSSKPHPFSVIVRRRKD